MSPWLSYLLIILVPSALIVFLFGLCCYCDQKLNVMNFLILNSYLGTSNLLVMKCSSLGGVPQAQMSSIMQYIEKLPSIPFHKLLVSCHKYLANTQILEGN